MRSALAVLVVLALIAVVALFVITGAMLFVGASAGDPWERLRNGCCWQCGGQLTPEMTRCAYSCDPCGLTFSGLECVHYSWFGSIPRDRGAASTHGVAPRERHVLTKEGRAPAGAS